MMRAITERRVGSGRARRHDNWSAEREWYKRCYDDNPSSSIDADDYQGDDYGYRKCKRHPTSYLTRNIQRC